MPRKSKGEKIDLIYTNKKEPKKKKSRNKTKGTVNSKPIEKASNEIIIGLTPKVELKTKSKVQKKKTKAVKKKIQKTKQPKKNKKIDKKKQMKFKIIKWTSIIIILIIAIILFLLSSVFNIKEIIVEGNNKVSSEEIISLSKLSKEENMFKILNSIIKKNVKQNAYIDDVKIVKKLNGKVYIKVCEREPKFMLQYDGYYAYINNQGFILEVTDIKLDLPLITGYKTPQEQIKAGNRLQLEDLGSLETIIKIMQAAKSCELEKKITYFDIENKDDYILKMENEGKTVYFGNDLNINEKILWIEKLLEEEKDFPGEMFIQDVKKVYFREQV